MTGVTGGGNYFYEMFRESSRWEKWASALAKASCDGRTVTPGGEMIVGCKLVTSGVAPKKTQWFQAEILRASSKFLFPAKSKLGVMT